MKLNTILISLCALLFAACATSSFGHRDDNPNVDQRLDGLLSDYEAGRNDGINSSGNLLVDCDRARGAIERLALEFPHHTRTLMAAASLSYENGEPEKAQNYLDQIFKLQSANPEAGILRSRIAIDDGNLPLAVRILAIQIQYTPDHAGLREAQSGVLYMSSDWKGARTAIDVAEALGAPPWRVAYHRGLIAEGAGDRAEARRQYQACLDKNPAFPAAQSRLSGMKAAGG